MKRGWVCSGLHVTVRGSLISGMVEIPLSWVSRGCSSCGDISWWCPNRFTETREALSTLKLLLRSHHILEFLLADTCATDHSDYRKNTFRIQQCSSYFPLLCSSKHTLFFLWSWPYPCTSQGHITDIVQFIYDYCPAPLPVNATEMSLLQHVLTSCPTEPYECELCLPTIPSSHI